ncbi:MULTISPECIES: hypothetical protein [unclassified Fusobacterium]|uniref:hypothetical protein n=1 Tax=unclassified Fusobacterium TaxID=2648384 RepID=UPI001B8ACB99|nr:MULTISPECIES: hypothetical protein [unclassified Fusobacterium]MBR8701037.1 hypothetical protein [Fusobacterium sp. DD45]MBR8710809.1 hypothetical protein [Fusobacterium sp. DD28]MBR8751413.1 hypothetical protein [Fusobacterium sp. DD26]
MIINFIGYEIIGEFINFSIFSCELENNKISLLSTRDIVYYPENKEFPKKLYDCFSVIPNLKIIRDLKKIELEMEQKFFAYDFYFFNSKENKIEILDLYNEFNIYFNDNFSKEYFKDVDFKKTPLREKMILFEISVLLEKINIKDKKILNFLKGE